MGAQRIPHPPSTSRCSAPLRSWIATPQSAPPCSLLMTGPDHGPQLRRSSRAPCRLAWFSQQAPMTQNDNLTHSPGLRPTRRSRAGVGRADKGDRFRRQQSSCHRRIKGCGRLRPDGTSSRMEVVASQPTTGKFLLEAAAAGHAGDVERLLAEGALVKFKLKVRDARPVSLPEAMLEGKGCVCPIA